MTATTSFQEYLHQQIHIKQEQDLVMASQDMEHFPPLLDPQSHADQHFDHLGMYSDVPPGFVFDIDPIQLAPTPLRSSELPFTTSFDSEWPSSLNSSFTSLYEPEGHDWLLNSELTTPISDGTLNPQLTLLASSSPAEPVSSFFAISTNSLGELEKSIQHGQMTEREDSVIDSTFDDNPLSEATTADDDDDYLEEADTFHATRKIPFYRRVRAAQDAQSATNGADKVPSIPVRLIDRDMKDELLLTLRRQGHSYREIKRIGKFTEADSTLRGRIRTLTKDKKDRVRKPVWQRKDERLLQDAVERHYSHGIFGRPKSSHKLPWKKIAAWMREQGSSYQFASATCAKKWLQLKRSA